MSSTAPLSQGSNDGTQSIRRALDLLDLLAAEGMRGMSLTEAGQAIGLSPPTVHRILNVLKGRGIVEQDDRTKRYAIGEQIPMLALARPTRSRILRAADPILQDAAQQLGDTIYLTVRAGLDALCVARVFGSYPIQVVTIEIGARRPLGVSSAGISILASLEPREVAQIVSKNEPRFARYQATRAQVLRAVQNSRASGYTIRHRGVVQGTKALSVPIARVEGFPDAALTIGTIDRRLTPRREAELEEALHGFARKLELSFTSERR